MKENLKRKLCNDLISSGQVKEGDMIRHSYTNSRADSFHIENKEYHDCSCTIPTRADTLGIVVRNKDKRLNALVNKTEFGQQTLALDTYNQTTHEEYVQTIRANVDSNNTTFIYKNLRIRKLTPKECWRLMGVVDADYKKVAVNQSNASMYHLAGDSIVVNVLMAIFGQMIKENL